MRILVFWDVSAALSVGGQNRGSFTFGVSGRCHYLLVHALRASIHKYELKTHMHFSFMREQ